MKARPVVWAPAAQNDLFHIRYLVDRNPTAADRVARRIQAAAADLGHAATGRSGRIAGTSEKVVRGLPYIIAYEIVTDGSAHEVLTILRIVHGARDWREDQWPPD